MNQTIRFKRKNDAISKFSAILEPSSKLWIHSERNYYNFPQPFRIDPFIQKI